MNNNKNTYIHGIDGIRALAVLSILIFHLNHSHLAGGFSGVDVFFVISGYVVSLTLSKNSSIDGLGLIFFGKFYARRILRILPALVICLTITSIFSTLLIPEAWLSSSINKTGLFAFFGLSNYALVSFQDGYFAPRVEFNPFAHTWSLGLEEQFYLIFPFIFFIWLALRKKNNLLNYLGNYLLPFLLIASLIFSSIETTTNPENAFYLLTSRFWELSCGAFLFIMHSQDKMLIRPQHQILFLSCGVTCLLLSFFLCDKQLFPFPWAIMAVAGTVLLISVIVSDTKKQPLVNAMFANKVSTQIGKTSYSLYLWHWPIYVILKWTIGLQTVTTILFALIMSFLLANISYYYIEQPIRKSKTIINLANWKVILLGLISIVLFSFTSNLVFKYQDKISLSVTKDKKTWYPIAWPDINDSNNTIYSNRKLFIVGDSHAGAYSTIAQKLSDRLGIKVMIYSKGGCGFVNLLTTGTLLGGISSEKACNEHNQHVISKIKSLASPGDIVFLSSLRVNRFGSQWHLFSEKEMNQVQFSQEAQRSRETALKQAKVLINEVQELDLNIIIEAPKPVFKAPPFRCSDWFNKYNPICKSGRKIKKAVLLKHRQPTMNSLEKLSQTFPNIAVWDPFPILCESDYCSSFNGDKPLFFDGHHLSAHGNRILYPSFTSLIKKIWS